MTEIAIEARGLAKRFGEVTALAGFDLEVEEGQTLTLLGPSGCGKTTALRVIAGFERPDVGEVAVGGVEVAGPGLHVPPERRRVGMVFQDYALFPHMSVASNVSYGIATTDGVKRVRARVSEAQRSPARCSVADARPAMTSAACRPARMASSMDE